MTQTPCSVAECIISIRPMYPCTGALTYLFSYTDGSGSIKPAISPKRLKIERKLLLTAYIKSCTGFRLPSKCMTLNDLCTRFKVIDCLNATKMAKYSLIMTPTPLGLHRISAPANPKSGHFSQIWLRPNF